MESIIPLPFEPQHKDTIILTLTSLLLLSLGVLLWLVRALLIEKKRQIIPALSLKPHLEPGYMGLYVDNIGAIPARDIVVLDMDVVIESNIGGAVTLKFDPVKMLPAGQQEKLNIKVFSGNFPIAHVTPENIVPHLTGAALEARLTYSNLQRIRFSALLSKEKNSGTFSVKEIMPLT